MNSTDQPKSSRSSRLTLIILFFALLVIGFAYIKLGFVLSFWIILITWIIFILYYFFSKIIQGIIIRIFLILIVIISVLITLGMIPGLNSSETTNTNSTGKFNLVDCTSSLSDKPQSLSGWNAQIYSGPLGENSPDPEQANNVRTFSYQGITDKTETNSIYAHFDKTDGSVITGFDTAIEVCDSTNKSNSIYSISSHDSSDVAGENVTGRTHYFHGGPYLFGSGTYRVDAYIKDTNGWHLVNRFEGIIITE